LIHFYFCPFGSRWFNAASLPPIPSARRNWPPPRPSTRPTASGGRRGTVQRRAAADEARILAAANSEWRLTRRSRYLPSLLTLPSSLLFCEEQSSELLDMNQRDGSILNKWWFTGHCHSMPIRCLFLCQRGEAIRGCVHGSAKRGDFSIHVIGCMNGIWPQVIVLLFSLLQWVID